MPKSFSALTKLAQYSLRGKVTFYWFTFDQITKTRFTLLPLSLIQISTFKVWYYKAFLVIKSLLSAKLAPTKDSYTLEYFVWLLNILFRCTFRPKGRLLALPTNIRKELELWVCDEHSISEMIFEKLSNVNLTSLKCLQFN